MDKDDVGAKPFHFTHRLHRVPQFKSREEPEVVGTVHPRHRTGPLPDLGKLAAWNEGNLTIVVETPRGASLKYAYDPSLQVFTLSKALVLGLTYPTDFGFIPSTLAEDGDPLDAFLIHDATTFPGLVLRCLVIGVLEVAERSGQGNPE